MPDFSNKTFTNADQEIVAYNGEAIQWRVSAYALIIQNEKLLILKNKNEKLYDVPGGGIELGETIEEALQREAMEEAGATITIGKLIHLQQGFFKHGNGNFYQTIQLFYNAELIADLQQPSDATTEFVQFIPLTGLGDYPLPNSVLNALEHLR